MCHELHSIPDKGLIWVLPWDLQQDFQVDVESPSSYETVKQQSHGKSWLVVGFRMEPLQMLISDLMELGDFKSSRWLFCLYPPYFPSLDNARDGGDLLWVWIRLQLNAAPFFCHPTLGKAVKKAWKVLF